MECRIRMLGAVLVGLLVGACTKSKDTIVVAADGSCTVTFLQTVTLEELAAVRTGLIQHFPTLLGPEFGSQNPLSKAWLQHLTKPLEDAEIVSFDEKAEEGRHTTRARTRFASLRDLARAGVIPGLGMALERDGANWKLTLSDAFLEPDPKSHFDPRLAIAFLAPALQHAEVSRSLTLPTRIVDSNGEVSADRHTVTWKVDFKEAAVNSLSPLHKSPWVTFEPLDTLEFEAFSVPADRDRLIRRFSQPPQSAEVEPDAKTAIAELNVKRIVLAALKYRIDHGYDPKSIEDLTRANRENDFTPYMANVPKDPWGHPYRIVEPGQTGRWVVSAGPDGAFDTDDDIREHIGRSFPPGVGED